MVIEKEASPLEGVPDLTFSRPQNEEDRTAGLKLVANVLSQQRSTTSKTLIYSPITVLLWAVIVGLMYPFVYRNPATDKSKLAVAMISILMSVLAGVRYLVKPYQDLADNINWEWLGKDEMVTAKFGDVVIGSCVYRLQDSGNKKEMLIRSWTTRPRERRRGVGRGLLELVVNIAKEKGCSGIDFAPDELRVGSTRLLTQLDGFAGILHINKGFAQEEAKARATLKNVLDERWSEKRTKGSR